MKDRKKYISILEQTNADLKKQLEEANKKLYLCTPEIPQNVHGKYISYVDLVNEMYELKKQQKVFIKYLEDEIENINKAESHLYQNKIPKYFELGIVKGEKNATKEILQKYKEIIGDNE